MIKRNCTNRSKDDLERQKKLAAKRVVLRKCRILNGELYKNPAEDKKQPEEGEDIFIIPFFVQTIWSISTSLCKDL